MTQPIPYQHPPLPGLSTYRIHASHPLTYRISLIISLLYNAPNEQHHCHHHRHHQSLRTTVKNSNQTTLTPPPPYFSTASQTTMTAI